MEAARNCFRYCGFTSFDEVDRLTIPEYELLMEATQLRFVDRQYEIHLQAWLTFAAKAQKKSGKGSKPVYKTFKHFFDYEKELEKVTKKSKEKSRFAGIGKLLKKGE